MAGLGCRVLQGCKDGMHHAMPWQRMQERGCAMTQAGHRRRAGVKDVIVHQVMCACAPHRTLGEWEHLGAGRGRPHAGAAAW